MIREGYIIGSTGYVLTASELVILMSLVKGERLYGLDENGKIFDKEDPVLMWESAKESLSNKNLLTQNSDGGVTIDRGLLEAVFACANPKMYCSFTYPTKTDNKYIGLYCNNNYIATIEKSENIESSYILVPYKKLSQAATVIKDYFDEVDYSEPECEVTYTLQANELSEIQEGKVTKVSDASFQDLIEAVRKDNSLLSIICINTKTNKTETNSALAGNKYIWHVFENNLSRRFAAIGSAKWQAELDKCFDILKEFVCLKQSELVLEGEYE